MSKANIKKGDLVIVLSGKNRGKKGKVLEVLPKDDKMIVERVNVAKKHQRPSKNFQGGIIEKPMPIKASKLMLVCPKCNEPTRVKRKEVDNKRLRACVSCNEIVDKV
ncbi:MAG: 50S ribosomal protein L24 [bacterium]